MLDDVDEGERKDAGRGAAKKAMTPDLMRGLTSARLSRRRFVRGAAGMLAVAPLIGALEACGISGTKDTGWEDGFDWAVLVEGAEGRRGLRLRQLAPVHRPDQGRLADAQRVQSKKNDVKVNYRPVIQDNASFFSQISPVLSAGQSIGYDLIVISDGWELTQMIENHWLIPLDHSRLPNFKRYAARRRQGPRLRPGQQVHGRLAVGDHRDRLRPREDRPRDHLGQGPLRPGVRGPRRDDGRRHRARQQRRCSR